MITDEEVVNLINDNSEESRELLFNSTKHLVGIYLNKYASTLKSNGIEKEDAQAECMLALNESFKSYDSNKNCSFNTFVSICIKRRLHKIIRNAMTHKNKFHNSLYSLDYVYEEFGLPLIDILESDQNPNPQKILENEEKMDILNLKIENSLSELELVVYNHLLDSMNYIEIAHLLEKDPKQIDNAIQRIKLKIKDIIKSSKEKNDNI